VRGGGASRICRRVRGGGLRGFARPLHKINKHAQNYYSCNPLKLETQRKNNAIHHKINDISIVWMLNHCKNNVIQCEINDICIAWMLNHCKNKAIYYAIHPKINNICIDWMLNHCKNNVIHCKINDICIYFTVLYYFVNKVEERLMQNLDSELENEAYLQLAIKDKPLTYGPYAIVERNVVRHWIRIGFALISQ